MEKEVEVCSKNAENTKVGPPPKPPRLRADHPRHSHTSANEATANEVLSVIITTTNIPHTAADTESDEKSLQNMQSKKKKKKKKLQFQSPLTNRSKTPPTSALPVEHTSYAIVRHDGKNVANVTETTTATPTRRRRTTTTAATTTTTKTRAETTHMLATRATAPAAHPVSSFKAPFAAAETETAAAAAQSTIKNRLVHGCTSLMYACQHGDIAEVLEQLRSKPERIRQRDSRNKNALHYCAAQNVQTRDLVAAASIAIAAPELLESADEDGFTPLHLAVIQGNLAMVNLLLANKADVNAVDNEGHSVVHWATVCGEVEALRSVLAAGANVATPDINGGSPLHYAAQMCGASYEGKLGQASSSKLAMEILGILLAHPQSSVDVQDKDGRQPLLWAASAGSAKAVIALVKAGARVESADKDGLTALHCAASRGHTECIDTLISLCGAPTDLIDSNGCTALHYAVTLGHADATSRLLELEADPNRQDRKGRTPAHCGCSKGQFETVKLLKERGANLWLRNAKGDLPVHEAASSGRRELVEWLLEQRSKQVNTTSNDGRSLLHIAAANDYTDMCKMVLDYGADINAIYRNSKGTVITPLDCSLQKGHRSTAKFLQSHGGLPAGKLRLAARRSNPFQEATTDVVRPLKYAEKEEIHDLRNSKKYVVYLKRSDSEGGDEGNCSCSEQTYKKEQRYEHRCHRHRQHNHRHHLRRRTSSCGEPKETCSGKDCSDICRSKSNIEIRRRKSRERYTSSTDLEENEDGEEDSCENCCFHKRQKQRVVRRRSTSSRRSKNMKDSDEDDGHERSEKDSSPDKRSKRAVDSGPNKEKNVEVAMEKPTSSSSRPGSKTSTRSRPQSATKRQTPPPSAGKEGTFIKSPPPSAKVEVPTKVEDGKKSSANALEMTDEEEQARAAEVVTTQVDVHRGADESSLKLSEETETEAKRGETQKDKNNENKVETVSEAEITEEITKEVDQVLKIAATAVNSESKSSEESQDVEPKQSMSEVSKETSAVDEIGKREDKKSSEESPSKSTEDKQEAIEGTENDSKEKPKDQMKLPNVIETPATPMPTPMPTPTPSPTPTAANTPQTTAPPTPQNEMTQTASVPETPTGSAPVSSDKPLPIPSPVPPSSTAAAATAAATKPPATSTSNEPYPKAEPTAASASTEDPQHAQQQREQESRRSFTLLPSDSAEDEEVEPPVRKSSFQVLKSDESVGELDDARPHPNVEEVEFSDAQVFKIVHDDELSSAEADRDHIDYEDDQEEEEEEEEDEEETAGAAAGTSSVRRFKGSAATRHGVGTAAESHAVASPYDYSNGRKRRLKKRIKSGSKTRSNWKSTHETSGGGGGGVGGVAAQQSTKDQDSGFEPSPRTTKSKIPTPRNIYTANVPRRPIYATLDGRTCSSRLENRKPGDKSACDMSAVTRSIQRNIRRYYMERKIFQHLLELKSLQIRSNKLNEAVLVKRAVDDYHKSCATLGGETGTRLRRYSFSEYTFKNFELFLYETLKTLQKPGTYNFQNINEVYEEAERRLSPDYNAYEKALQCTTKTHRCLHAAHAYTGIPCAAYIPMMNHHTMPKFGFGPYKKTGVGSFYLPKILTSSHSGCGGKVALEVSHGKSKQLISLPSEKMDSNKRYYVTFTVKETNNAAGDGNAAGDKEQTRAGGDGGGEAVAK